MRKLFTVLLIIGAALGLTGCYEQIPAGTVGKVMGKSGFQPEVYPPSKIWLEEFATATPEKLYLAQTTTQKFNEPFKVLLSDKLEIAGEIVFRGRIRSDKKTINYIFNDMTMNDNVVTVAEVYNTYGRMVVVNTARSVISKYNVDEVNKNYERITLELYQAIAPKLESLPLEISDVTIGRIQYPEIVTTAIEKAKEKQMAIEEEQAKVQIKLEELRGKEEAAKAEYRIKMLEAKRIRDYNKMTSEGITPDLIKLRELELRAQELEKWNGQLPTTLMGGNVPVIVNNK